MSCHDGSRLYRLSSAYSYSECDESIQYIEGNILTSDFRVVRILMKVSLLLLNNVKVES